MAKLDWEKHRHRQRVEQVRSSSAKAKARANRDRGSELYQLSLAQFAAKHSLDCFKCDRSDRRWAKSGINAKGPWIICVSCVARNRKEQAIDGGRSPGKTG